MTQHETSPHSYTIRKLCKRGIAYGEKQNIHIGGCCEIISRRRGRSYSRKYGNKWYRTYKRCERQKCIWRSLHVLSVSEGVYRIRVFQGYQPGGHNRCNEEVSRVSRGGIHVGYGEEDCEKGAKNTIIFSVTY